jgi:hypothetical protein
VYVPLPDVKSALIVTEVAETAVIGPSIQMEEVFEIRSLAPINQPKLDELVYVKVFEPVPIVLEVVLVLVMFAIIPVAPVTPVAPVAPTGP